MTDAVYFESILRCVEYVAVEAIIGASQDRKATAWLRSSHGRCGVCRQKLDAWAIRLEHCGRSGTSRGRDFAESEIRTQILASVFLDQNRIPS